MIQGARSHEIKIRNILFGQHSGDEMGKVCSTHWKILYLYNCYVMWKEEATWGTSG
jgi:hypothetical protein